MGDSAVGYSGKPPSLALASFSDDNPPDCHFVRKTGAGEEIRTLDPNLGKVPLARLSKSRRISAGQ
ncbi:MAG: hypothetical protein WBM39_04705 [Parasphingorhabdus sp.]